MGRITMEELEKMEDLSREDLDKILQKIRTIKKRKRSMASITDKYNAQMRLKFERSWGVEQAIRLVACALCGYSHSREVPKPEIERVCDVMEEIYKRLLEEE